MKTFQAIIILLYVGAYSQHLTTDVRSEQNIYLEALKAYCNTLDVAESASLNIEFDSYVMWYDWPKTIGNININYLESQKQILNEIRKNKDGIVLIKIVPLQFKNGKFYVNVIPFLAKSRGKNIEMINGGGLSVIYNFETIGFKFSEAKPYLN